MTQKFWWASFGVSVAAAFIGYMSLLDSDHIAKNVIIGTVGLIGAIYVGAKKLEWS